MILTPISHYPAHSFIYFVHSCFSAVFLSAYKFLKILNTIILFIGFVFHL